MSIPITNNERDALHELFLDRLSGIGGLRAPSSQYSDDLRLVLDRLDAGDGPNIELEVPPEVLRRVLSHEPSAGPESLERNRLAEKACQNLTRKLRGKS